MSARTHTVPAEAPTDCSAKTGSRHWLVVLLLLLVASAALSIAVQRNVFPFYSGDRDEPVYRYQAQMLADGHVTIPATQERFFRPWLSGPVDGHLAMAFEPLWPAVLMIAEVATNSMLPGVAFGVVLATAGIYALGVQLLRDRRLGLGAAVLFALSPFVLLLAGTYLNYVFAVGLGTWMTVGWVRAVRRSSAVAAAGAGALFGLLLLTRPFDALLATVPLLVFALVSRPDRAAWRRLLAGATAGAAPFVVLTLAYNLAVTGAAFEFATSAQSGGTAAFGWGRRALAPDYPPVNFTLLKAIRATAQNLVALPSWLLGSYVAVPLAAWGVRRLALRTPLIRTDTVLLVAMLVVFPVGYLGWWAIALTVDGAYTGIGPHYYLPMLVPLSILMAVGVRHLLSRLRDGGSRSRWYLGIVGVLAGLGTAAFVGPRLDVNRFVADQERLQALPVLAALRSQPGRILVINQREPHPYIMGTHGILANRPTLDTRVIFAVDRGAAGVDLLREHPHRRAFRTTRQLAPGAPLGSIHPVLVRQRVIRGTVANLDTTIENRGTTHIVIAYARFGNHRVARVIDTASRRGQRYQVRWRLSGAEISMESSEGSLPRTRYPRIKEEPRPHGPRAGPAPQVDVVVGATFTNRATAQDPDRVELRYYARRAGSDVEFLTAPEQWTRIGSPISAWLPITVGRTLRVDPSTPRHP